MSDEKKDLEFQEIEEFADDLVGASSRPEVTSSGLKRRFVELSRANTHGCNLTELCASERADDGYFDHTDWMGHVRIGNALEAFKPCRRDRSDYKSSRTCDIFETLPS